MAISHAQTVLTWQEHLAREEMPPEWMWPFDEELEAWFDEVDRKRDEKWGTGGSSDSEAPDMMRNEIAEARRRGR